LSVPAGGLVTDPAGFFQRVDATLGERYRPEMIVAASRERVLFRAEDLLLKRRVSLRINFFSDRAIRAWFMREAEALAQLNHPAIRGIYDAGVTGDIAYRVGTWIEGEGLNEALRRGPRPIPMVHTLARDLLSALEHAHANGIILRRLVPASLLITNSGHGTLTDARFASWTLPAVPADVTPTGLEFMAPEVRDGQTGDPASDVFAAGALLYYALTGIEPPLDPTRVRPPRELRPMTPVAMERVVLRALLPAPDDRYLNAVEMLEDFASDAGSFEMPAAAAPRHASDHEDSTRFEQRHRRALGD
jgi:serine/threonine-protein kinase